MASPFSSAEHLLGDPVGQPWVQFDRQAWLAICSIIQQLLVGGQEDVTIYQVPLFELTDAPPDSVWPECRTIAVPTSKPTGRPILLIEPHCDDAVLSLGGSLLLWRQPLIVVTLFNQSRTVDAAVGHQLKLTDRQISDLRRVENERALGLGLGARCFFLDWWEEPWPWNSPDISKVSRLCQSIRDLVDISKLEIIAPFGFSTHPDHYLARCVAEALGCNTFWEDLGFYGEYASSLYESEYGLAKWPGRYDIKMTSIEGVALLKMALLATYQSQIWPPTRMMAILRTHWAIARKCERAHHSSGQTRYVERLFIKST